MIPPVSLETFADPYTLVREVDEEGFLRRLNGPAVLYFKGRDASRCRVVVTLLHGNEPSGIRAVHRLAREQFVPLTDAFIIVASTKAALTPPVFTYRMLPGCDDLNRCFNHSGNPQQQALADAIRDFITNCASEAVIDLHNTSGKGPDFCVSTTASDQSIALSTHFSNTLIVTDIKLGSLMEQTLGCPVITAEAGGAQDCAADDNAYYGLRSFLLSQNVFEKKQSVTLLKHPRRLELISGKTISYSHAPDSVSIRLRQDIEQFNFGLTPAGTGLGYISEPVRDVLKLDKADEELANFFVIENHKLVNKVDLKLFMVTTNCDIAQSDCLFYFVTA